MKIVDVNASREGFVIVCVDWAEMDAETLETLRHVLGRRGRDVDSEILAACDKISENPKSAAIAGLRLNQTLAIQGRTSLGLAQEAVNASADEIRTSHAGVAVEDEFATPIVTIPAHTSCALVSRLTPLLHHVWIRATLANGKDEQAMCTGVSASSLRRIPCLDQGMCCASHYPAEFSAIAAAASAAVSPAVQRAAIATAEAAFRASARGSIILLSEYRGLYSEMNVTELCVRSHGLDTRSSGSGSGGHASACSSSGSSAGIVADLHRAVSEDLRQMTARVHSSPVEAADDTVDAEAAGAGAAAAAASPDRSSRSASLLPTSASPSRSAAASPAAVSKPSELDMLDARCMLGILEKSAAALQLQAASPAHAAAASSLPAASAAAVSLGAGSDTMVATATVSLLIDSDGQLLVAGRHSVSAAGCAPSVASSAERRAEPEDISAAAVPDPPPPEPLPADDAALIAALRPTLKTSFASLAQLLLRKGSLWLPFSRRVAGNLLLVEALQGHADLPRLQAATAPGAAPAPASEAVAVVPELRQLLSEACALQRRIASHRAGSGSAAAASAAAARAAAALAARPAWPAVGPRLVAETRPMILTVCKLDEVKAARRRAAAAAAAMSGEVAPPVKPLAAQPLLLPLGEVLAACSTASSATPCVFSAPVLLPGLSLSCRVVVTVMPAKASMLAHVELVVDADAAGASASAGSSLGVPLFLSTSTQSVAAAGRAVSVAGVDIAPADGFKDAPGSVSPSHAVSYRAHAGLSLLPPSPLRVVCLARLGPQLADVQVELRAQPHF